MELSKPLGGGSLA